MTRTDPRTLARALAAARVRALAGSPSVLGVLERGGPGADDVAAFVEELDRIAHRIEAHRPRRRGKPARPRRDPAA